MTTAADRLKHFIGRAHPLFAVVLGSSLGGLADGLAGAHAIPYSELPGFPVPSVSGHAGELVAGTLGGHTCLLYTSPSPRDS